MVTSKAIFEPEIPDREIDREAKKVEDKLDEIDEDIAPNVDTREMQRDIDKLDGPDLGGGGFDAASRPGGGGGGSLLGGAGAGAAIRGGGGSLLSSGGAAAAASAAIPVALAGAGLFAIKGIHDSLAKASPALQQMDTMFAAAIQNFRAPFGRALAGALEPSANSLLEASVEFRRAAEERGFGAAFQQLGEDFIGPKMGDLLEQDLANPIQDAIGDIRAGGEIGAVTGGIFGGEIGAQIGGALGSTMTAALIPVTVPLRAAVGLLQDVKGLLPNLPSVPDFSVDPNNVTFLGDVRLGLQEPTVDWSGATPSWGDIFTQPQWETLMSFPGISTWLEIIPPPPWSDVIGGFRTIVDDGLAGFSWDAFVNPFDWGTFVDPLDWNSFIDDVNPFSDGQDGQDDESTTPLQSTLQAANPSTTGTVTVTDPFKAMDFAADIQAGVDPLAGDFDFPGLQAGGRITQTGTARVHRGELVASPDRLVSDLAAAIDRAGGRGDSGRVVDELQRLRGELDGDGDERVVRELRRTREAIQALRNDLDGPADVSRLAR